MVVCLGMKIRRAKLNGRSQAADAGNRMFSSMARLFGAE